MIQLFCPFCDKGILLNLFGDKARILWRFNLTETQRNSSFQSRKNVLISFVVLTKQLKQGCSMDQWSPFTPDMSSASYMNTCNSKSKSPNPAQGLYCAPTLVLLSIHKFKGGKCQIILNLPLFFKSEFYFEGLDQKSYCTCLTWRLPVMRGVSPRLH